MKTARTLFCSLVVCLLMGTGGSLRAGEAIILIDAEFGIPTSTSAQAIELGARIAADEVNESRILGDIRLAIRTSDNRGIPAIAVDNFLEAVPNPAIIAVMGGKFSPPQMEVLPHSARNGLMLLNPWGSADGFIDNGLNPNWAFRLSLRDEFAAQAFLREAKMRGAGKIGLLLLNTAWGRSNLSALERQAAGSGMTITGTRWLNAGDRSFIALYRDLIETGPDLVILVANEVEGATMINELAAQDEKMKRPILSHWGITGGDFVRLARGAIDKVDISAIQTFSFHKPRSRTAESLLGQVVERSAATRIADIPSPVGIAQAYDLTWLVALALRQVGSVDRSKLRDAMLDLPPFDGAVRFYEQPFNAQRHEALSLNEVFFVRYDKEGGLVPIE
jgi:branched-chain amino acid transport system substrate-binding protein